jgi:hypothetical protein
MNDNTKLEKTVKERKPRLKKTTPSHEDEES